MKIQDNFHILRRAIEQAGNRERANELLSSTGRVIMETFMAKIEEAQPVDTTMAYKPSIRRGYTPIASGWHPIRIVPKINGVSLTLKSTSQHINIQRFGTERKNYPIPASPTGVYFWWGSPLPWAPTEVPELIAKAPGMFWFPQIAHPGIEAYGGSDFVRRAWGMVQQLAKNRFTETADRILFEPFRSMG